MKRKATSDVFDINKNTGALILGSNRLDDYASKFLTKYCKEALLKPMPLPVEEIIQKMRLTVREIGLSENLDIFGCCLLLDSDVKIYDREKNEYKEAFFEAGTLLIDPYSSAYYGEGAKRNTLVHEMLHWEKDKRYFEILKIKYRRAAEKLYPIMCRQSKTFFRPAEGKKTKENEVYWLEWQAHRLAPRILMPRNSFTNKALSLMKENPNISCAELVDGLSDFFIVSKSSAKYRLLEVGLEETVRKFADYSDVYFDAEVSKEFISLSPIEAFKMIEENPDFSKWIRAGNFIYVDGYFVLPESKNISVDADGDLHLSNSVRKNLSRSVINIREFHFTDYAYSDADISKFAFLKKIVETDKRLYAFHPHFQSNLKLKEEGQIYSYALAEISRNNYEEEKDLIRLISDPDTTLCQCLWHMFEKRNWKSPEDFENETELHKNYFGLIRNNNKNNMTKDQLLTIAIALKLRLRMIDRLLSKANHRLDDYREPDKTYIQILENFPKISLADFNILLEIKEIEPLGTKSRN
jgi:hypothetical protein